MREATPKPKPSSKPKAGGAFALLDEDDDDNDDDEGEVTVVEKAEWWALFWDSPSRIATYPTMGLPDSFPCRRCWKTVCRQFITPTTDHTSPDVAKMNTLERGAQSLLERSGR